MDNTNRIYNDDVDNVRGWFNDLNERQVRGIEEADCNGSLFGED